MPKFGRFWNWLPVLLAIVLLASVTAACAVTGAEGKVTPARVSTPGAVRVIQNDTWVYYDELAEGEGFVEVSANPGAAWIEKTPRGWRSM